MDNQTPVRYKSQSGYSTSSLVILITTLGITSIVLGGLTSLIGQLFYMIVIFPVAIGLVLALVGKNVAHRTKMRSTLMANMLGVLAACLAMGTLHFCDYLRFRQLRQKILDNPNVTGLINDPMLPSNLRETEIFVRQLRDVDNFLSYLDFSAKQGVAISYRGQKSATIGYGGAWAIWFAELIIVAAITSISISKGATAPFCSRCNLWKSQRLLGAMRNRRDKVMEIVRTGNLDLLKRLEIVPHSVTLLFTVAICDRCGTQSPIDVKVEEVERHENGGVETTQLVHMTYPGNQLETFERIFAEKPSTLIETSPLESPKPN